MRSDRWHEFSRTFRFRLAAQHVLLVSAALLLTFAVSFSVVKSFALKEVGKYLSSAAHRAQNEYLGRIAPPEATQLPEALLQKIESDFPGFHIGLVEREDQPGGWTYEVIGSTGSEQLEILAGLPGKIWIVERRPLAAVFHDMQASLHVSTSRGFDLFIYSPEGTLLAGTSSPGFPSDRLLADIRGKKISEPVLLNMGGLWFGATRLYDGNILCISDPQNAVAGITRLWIWFFALLLLLFLPMVGWIGYHISRRAMAGVKRVSAAANLVRAGHLHERVAQGTEGIEIEALAADFNGMVAHIEMLVQELRDVTANIAHDLRTPIARIRGTLESLNWAEISPDERAQIAGAAIEECDRIMPLIDNILELARADAGMLVLQEETFDLSSEIRTAHDIFSVLADDRRIGFSCAVPAAPVQMTGDRSRMQRIIANLIDNALKFTPEGGKVSVALESDNRQAALTVRDNGPGIAAHELARVFERFYRCDRSRSSPGHGLGLSLVNAFVKTQGGTVTIDSSTGKGCAVTVRVPL